MDFSKPLKTDQENSVIDSFASHPHQGLHQNNPVSLTIQNPISKRRKSSFAIMETRDIKQAVVNDRFELNSPQTLNQLSNVTKEVNQLLSLAPQPKAVLSQPESPQLIQDVNPLVLESTDIVSETNYYDKLSHQDLLLILGQTIEDKRYYEEQLAKVENKILVLKNRMSMPARLDQHNIHPSLELDKDLVNSVYEESLGIYHPNSFFWSPQLKKPDMKGNKIFKKPSLQPALQKTKKGSILKEVNIIE